MAEAETAQVRGLIGALLRFTGSVQRHLVARANLAGVEAQDAARHWVRVLTVLCAGIFLALFAYFFALLFIVSLLGAVCGLAWYWVALIISVGHAIGAALCAGFVRRSIGKPLFEATRAELQKDFASLHGSAS